MKKILLPILALVAILLSSCSGRKTINEADYPVENKNKTEEILIVENGNITDEIVAVENENKADKILAAKNELELAKKELEESKKEIDRLQKELELANKKPEEISVANDDKDSQDELDYYKISRLQFKFYNNRVNDLINDIKLDKSIIIYQDEIGAYDFTNINSVDRALEAYKSYATEDKRFNDSLFEVFYSYIFAMKDFHYSDYYHESWLDERIYEECEKNGFMFLSVEGSSFLEVDPTYLYETFRPFLSDAINEKNKIISDEQQQTYGTPYCMDGGLCISWEQLMNRIITREDYYKKYINTEYADEAQDVKNENETYLRIYTGQFVLPNTPPHVDSSLDLDPDLIESYKKFINEHSDSEYYPIIKKVYDRFEDNDFIYEWENLIEFYRSIFGD